MPSLLDRMFAGNQFGAESMSAAYRNRYPTTPPPQSGTSALANFGQMLPGLVGDYMDAQTANKALTAAETAKRQRELYFNQLEEQRLKEQGGPLASRSGPQAGPLERPDGFMMDIPSGPLETSGQSYESMLNRGRAQYPTDIAQIREEEVKKRTRATAEAAQKATAAGDAPLGGAGTLTRDEAISEVDATEFTPESHQQFMQSGDLGDLRPTNAADVPTFKDDMSARKYTEGQLGFYENTQKNMDLAWSLLEGETGQEELTGTIKILRAIDDNAVREGEVYMANAAAGAASWLTNKWEQITKKGGSFLDPEAKEGFRNVLRRMTKLAKSGYDKDYKHLDTQFKGKGFKDIMPRKLEWQDYGELKGGKPPLDFTTENTRMLDTYGIDPQAPDARQQLKDALEREEAAEEMRGMGPLMRRNV